MISLQGSFRDIQDFGAEVDVQKPTTTDTFRRGKISGHFVATYGFPPAFPTASLWELLE